MAELDGNKIVGIEEKPQHPKNKFEVTGLEIYDNEVLNVVKTLKPSKKGKFEITYLKIMSWGT